MDKRRFHRVTCAVPGELVHHEMSYACRLENVSLRGALISADECIMVPLGEICTLSMPLQAGGLPVTVEAVVVHSFFSMVGLLFTHFNGDAERRLLEFMRERTGEPEKLMQEWEGIVAERERMQMPAPTAAAAP